MEMPAGIIILTKNIAMSYEEIDFTDAKMLRMKAEEQLKAKLKNEIPKKEADEKRIMHELQVHQIELEMQNEELRKAYETAESALKKYTLLYDLAPMGYFTLNSEGSISELNFTGADMLGDRRISLLNSNFKLFVSEQSLSVFNRFFSKVHDRKGKESCEVILGYDNNVLCPAYIEGIVIDDDKKCLLSVVDISGFRK